MVIFFYFDKSLKVAHQELDFAYDHKFEGVQKDADGQVPFSHIYFSTPSDFHNHLENIKRQIGEEAGEVHVVAPEAIASHPSFPEHIGFQKLEEVVEKYRGSETFRLAILNGMSNAIGDHLIGMQAFEIFHKRLQELLPNVRLDVSFYQINPYRLATITRQSPHIDRIYMLPNRLIRLSENDAFVDLGTLLMRENFGKQPMIDFFLESLSIDPQTVPPEQKRMKYRLDTEALLRTKKVLNNVRTRGRPILLFHHTSTTQIRQMSEPRCRMFLTELLKRSNYFVISADVLDFSHERFLNLNWLSKNSLDLYAAIISQVDAMITVDTLSYHLADAFDIPTVVLFTTIEPDLRIRYYPYTESIMLEGKDGKLYGKHKESKEPEIAREECEYIEQKWAQLKVEDVLSKLKKVRQRAKGET